MMQNLVGIIMFSCLALWGATELYNTLKVSRKALLCKTWPKANGLIVSSDIVTINIPSRHGSGVMYEPKINYSYSINAKKFSGNQIRFE